MAPSFEALQKFDRTDFTPAHRGPRVLPKTSYFSTLLLHAHVPGRLAIRDVNRNGLEKTYEELLSDALHLRNAISARLPRDLVERIESDTEEICIGVLAAGGYEFVVAVLAVIALGAVVVPMSVALPVKEAAYFVQKSKQVAVITSESATELGQRVVRSINGTWSGPHGNKTRLVSIPILPNISNEQPYPAASISISSGKYLSQDATGVVIFTSGTTGPPKGAALRRGYISDASARIAAHFGLDHDDAVLHLMPVHHVSGLVINILPFLLAGSCIEFKSGGFDVEWTWRRWCDAASKGPRLTLFSGVPTIYMRMMRYYEARIAKLDREERQNYVAGARQFRALLCGTSALPRPVADFWTGLRGKPIYIRYGSTEAGAVLMVPLHDTPPEGAAGKVVPGAEVKLVDADSGIEGDEGEILVRAPELFSKYIDDAEATRKAFTDDGFFKTGDIAKREGEWYWIIGRASQDIIKTGGYKISALDVEREILSLPYVSEVVVVGVPDEEFGERVAAVVSLRDDQSVRSPSLDALRGDLRHAMASYKMPTLLRVVETELPKTASGKVLKKDLRSQYFPSPGWESEAEVQVWRSKASKI